MVGRTGRILVDFGDDNFFGNGESWDTEPVAFASEHPAYADLGNGIIVWQLGLISFGAVTLEQERFMAGDPASQSIYDFPGDFISAGYGAIDLGTGVTQSVGDVDFNSDDKDQFSYDDTVSVYRISWGGNNQIQYYYGDYLVVDGAGGQIGYRYDGLTDRPLAGESPFDIKGSAAAETLTGNDIGQTIQGLGGDDTLNGGGGGDRLIGGAGDDVMDGGRGRDTVDYSDQSAPVSVNLATGVASGSGIGRDRLSRIEIALGGSGDDTLVGTTAANSFAPIVKGRQTVNGNVATAVSLDEAFALFADANVEESNRLPHATVRATSSGQIEYYAFDVLAAGVSAVFDIDATSAGIDTFLTLEDANGNLYSASDNDAGDPGSTITTDSRLFYTFDAPGRYYIAVWNAWAGAIAAGGTYTLHVSLSQVAEELVEGSRLQGSGGDDLLVSGRGNDVLDGGSGRDTASFAQSRQTVVADLVTGVASGDGADKFAGIENLTGSAFSDRLTGDGQDNVLEGGAGDDVLVGGDGIDAASYATAATAVLVSLATTAAQNTGGAGTDTLSGIEALVGSAFNDRLTGDSGDNVIDGGAGNDLLTGGGGSDTASYASAAAAVTVSLGTANSQNTVGAGVDTLAGFANVLGSRFADMLTGSAAANRIDGGTGADRMVGLAGNDIYVVDNVADAVVEAAGGGDDTVLSSISYTLAAQVEALTLTGSAAIDGTGNELNNILTGNSATNVLIGGAGDDLYIVGRGDRVVEANGGGIDTVRSEASFTLAEDVENLELVGSAAEGRGNGLANIITGNALDNLIEGAAGDDALDGGDGIDTASYEGAGAVIVSLVTTAAQATGGAGTDRLRNFENLLGSAFGDSLTGSSIANRLDGGNGADTLIGGSGDDTYVLDNAGDRVIEAGGTGSGNDLVLSAVNYTLETNVERLTLTGTAAAGGGNEQDNVITGNAGANILTGAGGADVLVGGGGDDTLDGGTGADRMEGGAGNDSYVVDQVSDVVVEDELSGGDDVVRASVSYSLGSGVERLVLTGTASINGSGNALANGIIGNGAANRLVGNDGDDTLDGGAGADILEGGYGNDRYVVDNAGDQVIDAGDGDDLVRASISYTLGDMIEALTLVGTATNGTGNARGNAITGNTANNVLSGLAGNDRLAGGGGNDTLDGGADDDVLAGGAGDDLLRGGDGFDTADYSADTTGITFNTVAGRVTGSASGADMLASIEQLVGGSGMNFISYESASAGIDFDLQNNAISSGSNDLADLTVRGFEGVVGTANNDTLRGDEQNNRLAGGRGNDVLDGRAGFDWADYSRETVALYADLDRGFANGATGGSVSAGGIALSDDGRPAALVPVDLIGQDRLSEIEGVIGGSGNDTLVAANVLDRDRTATNVTWATADVDERGIDTNEALSLDAAFSLAADDRIENSTTYAHARVSAAALSENSEPDLYSFTVARAGARIIVDLDGGAAPGVDRDSGDIRSFFGFDARIDVYDHAGNLIASNDDNYLLDPGSNVARDRSSDRSASGINEFTLDPFVSFDAPSDGEYVVRVSHVGGEPGYYEDYTLNVSVQDYTLGSWLDGGAGNDRLVSGVGSDRLDGGAGIDEVRFDEFARGGIIADLTKGRASGAGTDVIRNVENLVGSRFDDALTGDASVNRIDGGEGHDRIDGGAGGDILIGGAGEDILSYTGSRAAIRIDLLSGVAAGGDAEGDVFTGFESVVATAADDILSGTAGANGLVGGAGNDRLVGRGGNDALVGDAGRDTAVFDGFLRTYNIAVNGGFGQVSKGWVANLGSVERLEFADGVFQYDPDGLGSQVIRLYDAVLQRTPDNGGLDFYLDFLEDRGGSLLNIANDLIGSAEFQTATGSLTSRQFVDYVYQHTLGRVADTGGRNFYIQQLDSGAMTRGALLSSFSESGEHRGLTEARIARGYFTTDDTYQSIALLYDGALGRLPDAGGLSYYAERVKAGTMTIAQVATDFAGSAEFTSAIRGKSNGEIVDFIYQNTLDRTPDAGGRAFYGDILDRGGSAAAVFQDIALSAEHYVLYSAHITYGIDIL